MVTLRIRNISSWWSSNFFVLRAQNVFADPDMSNAIKSTKPTMIQKKKKEESLQPDQTKKSINEFLLSAHSEYAAYRKIPLLSQR